MIKGATYVVVGLSANLILRRIPAFILFHSTPLCWIPAANLVCVITTGGGIMIRAARLSGRIARHNFIGIISASITTHICRRSAHDSIIRRAAHVFRGAADSRVVPIVVSAAGIRRGHALD